jgi:hypothetical protein
MCTKFSLEFLKGRNHSEDPGTDGRIILKWVVREMGLWTGYIWLPTRIGGMNMVT